MARPVTLTKTLAASSATSICASQAGAAGVPLIINGPTAVTVDLPGFSIGAQAFAPGGVFNAIAVPSSVIAKLDTQRRVLITSAGDDSGITFTVRGYDDTGGPRVVTFAGGNATSAASPIDFAEVVSIVPSGATTSTVEVGTNDTGSTPWVAFNPHLSPPDIGFSLTFPAGTATASAEYCIDPFLPPIPATGFGGAPSLANADPTPNPQPYAVTGLSAINTTATVGSLKDTAILGWRLTVTSGTGTAQLTGVQAGIRQS